MICCENDVDVALLIKLHLPPLKIANFKKLIPITKSPIAKLQKLAQFTNFTKIKKPSP